MKAGEDAHEIVFLVRFIVSSEQVIHSAPTLSTKTSRWTSGYVAMNVHLLRIRGMSIKAAKIYESQRNFRQSMSLKIRDTHE